MSKVDRLLRNHLDESRPYLVLVRQAPCDVVRSNLLRGF
jgi:hypothetical protein